MKTHVMMFSPNDAARMAKIDQELGCLLDKASRHELSPRERWLQRVSFAFGNAAIENPYVTREMVEMVATGLYGPCP